MDIKLLVEHFFYFSRVLHTFCCVLLCRHGKCYNYVQNVMFQFLITVIDFTDRRTDRLTDRQTDGQTDIWPDRYCR